MALLGEVLPATLPITRDRQVIPVCWKKKASTTDRKAIVVVPVQLAQFVHGAHLAVPSRILMNVTSLCAAPTAMLLVFFLHSSVP